MDIGSLVIGYFIGFAVGITSVVIPYIKLTKDKSIKHPLTGSELKVRRVRITLCESNWTVLGFLAGKGAGAIVGDEFMLSPEKVLEDYLSVLIKLGTTTENWYDLLLDITQESWWEILETKIEF